MFCNAIRQAVAGMGWDWGGMSGQVSTRNEAVDTQVTSGSDMRGQGWGYCHIA